MPINLLEETYPDINTYQVINKIRNIRNRIFESYKGNRKFGSYNDSNIKEILKVMQPFNDIDNQISTSIREREKIISYYARMTIEFHPKITEKVLSRFEGRVENIRGKNISVSLIDEMTKETFIAECTSEEFERSNIRDIYEEMKFICEILERGGDTIVRLKPFERLKLSAEEINKIRKEIEEDLK